MIGLVAHTGSSLVWKAHDRSLDRFVALKEQAADSDPALLQAEAKVLARLDHPHIVRVIDVITDEHTAYLVEEWVEGAQLGVIRDHSGRLSPAQAVGTVRGALQGLAFAHERDITHGDISPGNIMVDLAGTSKLIDFGRSDHSRGTAGFGAPEIGVESVSKRSDVYSAAAVLADLLRDGPAGTGDSPSLDGIPHAVAAVLARALRHDPADRQSDAAELLRDLDQAAERSLGAAWMTLAGMSGAVSATLGAGGVALVGAAGETAGSAIAATAAPAAGKSARWLISAAGAVAVAAVVVGVSLLTSTHRSAQSEAPPNSTVVSKTPSHSPSALTNGPPSAASTPVTTSAITSVPLTTTPAAGTTVARTSTANVRTSSTAATRSTGRGFSGTYSFTTVALKSNFPGVPAGTRHVTTWTVTSGCVTLACDPHVRSSSGTPLPYKASHGSYTFSERATLKCVVKTTGIPYGPTVTYVATATLKPTIVAGTVVALYGTERDSAPKCPGGVYGKVTLDDTDVRHQAVWKISITRKGP